MCHLASRCHQRMTCFYCKQPYTCALSETDGQYDGRSNKQPPLVANDSWLQDLKNSSAAVLKPATQMIKLALSSHRAATERLWRCFSVGIANEYWLRRTLFSMNQQISPLPLIADNDQLTNAGRISRCSAKHWSKTQLQFIGSENFGKMHSIGQVIGQSFRERSNRYSWFAYWHNTYCHYWCSMFLWICRGLLLYTYHLTFTLLPVIWLSPCHVSFGFYRTESDVGATPAADGTVTMFTMNLTHKPESVNLTHRLICVSTSFGHQRPR